MADQHCANLGIPEHLHQEGRDATPIADSEILYRRFNLHTEGDISACIKFGDMSVNRGSLSSADDVLINSETGANYQDHGVIEFPVEALRGSWTAQDQKPSINYSLAAKHVPLRCNFAHAEVEVFKDGKKTAQLKPPTVKLKMRQQLQQFVKVIRPISISGSSLPLVEE
jgi:hypothetical protein